jgi:vitellogenic carboxypeptidase-like protein
LFISIEPFESEIRVQIEWFCERLQGGPGATSMFGLFVEHGPFRIHKSMKLSIRPYRWTKLANMLYIDNPVGTGFSFTGSGDGYSRNEDQVGRNLYEALTQFYTMFPQYQAGDFYVTGESYGGKYVPAISYRIHLENPNATLKIPLKGISNLQSISKQFTKYRGFCTLLEFFLIFLNSGLAIGNGLVDPGTMMQYGDMLYQMGMVDESQRDTFHGYEDAFRKAVKEQKWHDAFIIFDTLLNGKLDRVSMAWP